MAFRTLVIGMIVLGLASGWMSHWIFPIVTTMAPDKEVVTSRGTQKCRTVRTVLDSKDAAPSCFSVIHEDLANGDRTYDEDGEEDPAAIWHVVGPFLKVGLVGLVAFISGGFAFFLYRRAQANSKLATIKSDAPDSEMPPESVPPAKLGKKVLEKRKPARAVKLFKSAAPHCGHCKSTNVRRSKMHPHKSAGINFTEYFRCKNCGRHFAIVSYTSILATGGAIVAALILVTASFIYVFSIA